MKKIGIPGWVIDGKTFGIGLAYAEFIRKFGQLIILNPDEPIRDDLDLLFLSGGADITPHQHRNSRLSLYTQSSNPILEYFDNTCLEKYIEQGTPIFGVCRGAQKLWSLFGGNIVQNCYNHDQSSTNKHECHGLHFDTKFEKEYSPLVDSVTSRHHQTMSSKEKYPHDTLEVIAWAKEMWGKKPVIRHDIVEIFTVRNKNIIGVQYHPEDNSTEYLSHSLIKKLLKDE